MPKLKKLSDEVFLYQDYLIRRIDYLCFTLSDRPNAVNRRLVSLIDDLKSLKDD